MSEAARIPNHITHVVLHGGNDDNNPMNHTIAHSGFLSLADFMTYTRDNLNNLIPCAEELHHESLTFLDRPTAGDARLDDCHCQDL